MLDAVKDYAQLQLKQRGELDRLRAEHLQYYVKLAEKIKSDFANIDEVEYLLRLEGDYENFRAAWAWSQHLRDDETGYRLVRALSRFWDIGGYSLEGCQWMEHLLRDGTHLSASHLAKLLNTLGGLTHNLGCFEDAKMYYVKLMDLGNQNNDEQILAKAYHGIGYELFSLGNYNLAREHYALSLNLWSYSKQIDETERTNGIRQSNCNIGLLEFRAGNYDEGKIRLLTSLKLCEEAHNSKGCFFALYNLADLNLSVGDLPEAFHYCSEALRFVAKEDKQNWAYLNYLYGYLDCIQRRFEAARQKYEQSLKILEEIGDKQGIAIAHFYLGRLYFSQGLNSQAALSFEQSIIMREKMGLKRGIVECLEGLAMLCHAEDELTHSTILLAAAANMRIELSAPVPPINSQMLLNLEQSLRATMDTNTFQSAWKKGSELSVDVNASVKYARFVAHT